jgi:1,2-diacylglycerol 3-alpha-glucosyltransferase
MSNVLIVVSVFYPQISGVSTRLKYMINLLSKHGFQFTVATPYPRSESAELYEIVKLPGFKQPETLSNIKDDDLMLINIFRYWTIYGLLDDTVKSKGIDVIHVIGPEPCGFIANKVASDNNIQCVHSYHTDIIRYLEMADMVWPLIWLVKKVLEYTGLNYADKLAAPSQDTLVSLKDYGMLWRDVDECSVIPPFAPFNAKPRDGGNNKVLVYVGRLLHQKSVARIIDVMDELQDYKLLIVGGGKQMQEFVDHAKGKENIEFTGPIEHNKIEEFYKKGGIFIQPSESETQGLATIEALVCGLVPIAYPAGGTLEIVKEDLNGLYFTTNEELIQKIRSLENVELYDKLKKGSKRYADSLSHDKVVQWWTDFYADSRKQAISMTLIEPDMVVE